MELKILCNEKKLKLFVTYDYFYKQYLKENI